MGFVLSMWIKTVSLTFFSFFYLVSWSFWMVLANKWNNYLHKHFEQGWLPDGMNVWFVQSVRFGCKKRECSPTQPLSTPAVCLWNHIMHLLSIFIIGNLHQLHGMGIKRLNKSMALKLRIFHIISIFPSLRPSLFLRTSMCFVIEHHEAPLYYTVQCISFQGSPDAFCCASFLLRYNLCSLT